MIESKFKVGDKVRVNGCWHEVTEVIPAHYSHWHTGIIFYRLDHGWACGEGLLTSQADYEAKQAQRKAAAQQRYDNRPDDATLKAERRERELKRIA